MKKLLLLMIISVILFLPQWSQAWECYQDPIYEKDLWGQYDIAAYVLERPCSGTTKLEVVPQGTILHIIAETDGWYKVETNEDNIGWTGSRLMTLVDKPSNNIEIENTVNDTEIENTTSNQNQLNQSFKARTQGQLLLQVESHGEIWYVDPVSYERYHATTDNALPLFRKLSLGITNSDLSQIPIYNGATYNSNNALANRLAGRLLLAVEDLGRVWYVDFNGYRREIRQENIMQIFRSLGLGVTNNDLGNIPVGDLNGFQLIEEETVVDDNVINEEINDSTNQAGEIPSNIDLLAANTYWLNKVNELRADSGLRQLELDQRFVDTATEWAVYTGRDLGYSTHDRPDGSSMHDWIDNKYLAWTERYSEPDGWVNNYFTENIAWGYTNNNQASLEQTMDYTLQWMLDEASYNGAHYRTLFHPDWNSVGVGFYFEKVDDNSYKVYIVMHYGSLK